MLSHDPLWRKLQHSLAFGVILCYNYQARECPESDKSVASSGRWTVRTHHRPTIICREEKENLNHVQTTRQESIEKIG